MFNSSKNTFNAVLLIYENLTFPLDGSANLFEFKDFRIWTTLFETCPITGAQE
jgi:hypothetical protein